jgi:hypothetical protein
MTSGRDNPVRDYIQANTGRYPPEAMRTKLLEADHDPFGTCVAAFAVGRG